MLAFVVLAAVAVVAPASAVDADRLTLRALDWGSRGRFDRAHTLLRRAAAADPWSIAVRRASDLCSSVENGSVTDATGRLLAQGMLFQQRSAWEPAALCYENAVRAAPDLAFAHHNLGAAYFEVGRNQEGLAELEAAARLDPSSAYTQNDLGLALDRAGRNQEALEHYRTAISLDPTYYKPYKNAAIDLLWLGREAEAQPLLARALEIYPDYVLAYASATVAPEEVEHLRRETAGDGAAALAARLTASRWQERKVAARLLVERRDQAAGAALVQLLRQGSSVTTYAALEALSALAGDREAKAIARSLTHREWAVRRQAGRTLRAQRSPRSVDLLIRRFPRESDDLVRLDMASGFADLGDPRAAPVLLGALQSRRFGLRAAVRGALRSLPRWEEVAALHRRDLPALTALLRDDDPTLRVRAATALGRFHTTRVIAPLVNALTDPEETVRAAAVAALARATGERPGVTAEAWQAWWTAHRGTR